MENNAERFGACGEVKVSEFVRHDRGMKFSESTTIYLFYVPHTVVRWMGNTYKICRQLRVDEHRRKILLCSTRVMFIIRV
jgi:hypothetical protein